MIQNPLSKTNVKTLNSVLEALHEFTHCEDEELLAGLSSSEREDLEYLEKCILHALETNQQHPAKKEMKCYLASYKEHANES